jgi:hypothetical protein
MQFYSYGTWFENLLNFKIIEGYNFVPQLYTVYLCYTLIFQCAVDYYNCVRNNQPSLYKWNYLGEMHRIMHCTCDIWTRRKWFGDRELHSK